MIVLKKIVVGAISLTILLAGCGGNKETNEEKVKMAQVMNDGNKTISYLVNSEDGEHNLTKNSKIDKYIISEDGKIKVYNDTGKTKLGKISKMEDKDLEKYIKEEDKKYFEEDKKYTLEKMKEFKENKRSEVLGNKKAYENNESEIKDEKDDEKIKDSKEYKKQIEQEMNRKEKSYHYAEKIIEDIKGAKYDTPKERDLKTEVIANESGTKSEEERMNIVAHKFTDVDDKGNFYLSDKKAKNIKEYNSYFTDSMTTEKIFDKKYAGISNYSVSGENENVSYLITEVGDKADGGVLDNPSDSNVKEIDEESHISEMQE